MKKFGFKTLVVALFAIILFSTANMNTVDAKGKTSSNTDQVLFSEIVTLENKNTKVDVGFVTVTFGKNTFEEDAYPITFEIEVYAEDGDCYVEFSPDYDQFLKSVKITVNKYQGFIFDQELDDFIYVEVPRTVFRVPHFSRWCFYR